MLTHRIHLSLAPVSFICALPFFFSFNVSPSTQIYTFPTRRSSDLTGCIGIDDLWLEEAFGDDFIGAIGLQAAIVATARSEEHTSELQSHSDLVCRLLLEKKKH